MQQPGLILTLALGWMSTRADSAALDSIGRTLTSWDCCKPACAWSSSLRQNSNAHGYVKVCDKNDNPLSQSSGQSAQSSCSSSTGSGYLCSDYVPRPQSDNFSFGFAITDGVENCCKCYELTWTDGPSKGRTMQVQIINEGGQGPNGTDGNGRDIIILTPGGGVGPNTRGCNSQFGDSWGDQYGGVTSRDACATLPSNLQAGCYWRFNWAQGDINNWPIRYHEIGCPDQLTSISGCTTS
ncbi:hypothetical protein VTK73DRAFT_3691 [Phialemonium thermophilum]|uniref:cellulase n=1 Tax=Phialemonium thermophilum TaxID=223376 RepID=A0ABR3WYG0_9PEZI